MTKPNLTDQQHQAIVKRRASVVLSSGAGCGKTHVLTERYLSHLRDDRAEIGQIVAITFTDRAARQMRDRIRQAILKELRQAHADEEAERWAGHLQGLETATICTIHSFCGALLRQHAVAAGLDPHFDVLEEVLANSLEGQALNDSLQTLLTSTSQAGEDLRELVLWYGWRPVHEGVRNLLSAWDGSAWAAWLQLDAAEVQRRWLDDVRRRLQREYVPFTLNTNPKIRHCLRLFRTLPCHGPDMKERVRQVLDQTPLLTETTDMEAALREITEAAKVGKDKANAWPSEEDYQAVKAAMEDFRKTLKEDFTIFMAPPENLSDAVVAGQRFLRVAREVAHAYQQRKRRASVVDFQDLLVLARDLLRDHADIRERLQHRYQHVLIDELQDTDPVQMEVVELLCGHGLTAGKLFAVGDHKQSIYRFRGADVHLFQKLKSDMPHEGRMHLTLNFRSQPAILDFVNALFDPFDPAGLPTIQDYEPLAAQVPQVTPGPCVEFLWSPCEPGAPVLDKRTLEADWIARRIAAMLTHQERIVTDKIDGRYVSRPVQLRDIVLLFRAMSNVHLYEAALRKYGLDYYLVGGRAFFAQQEILDLLNLLRAVENPQDGVSLAGAWRSPFCCLSDEAIFLLCRHAAGPWAGLFDDACLARLPEEQRPVAERARRFLARWRGLKDRLPIAQFLGAVLADSGYDAALQFEPLGDRKLANLWKLMDMARTFDHSGLFGLADFIQRLDEMVRSQPREEQAATQPEIAAVIRLMTIHQAKGLEFPVVFVPDLTSKRGGPHLAVTHWEPRMGCLARPPADEDPPSFSDLAWRLWQAEQRMEDWHEDLRTLYVACTRAQDYLVLSAAVEPDETPKNSWSMLLAERFDWQTGECRNPSIPAPRRPQIRICDAWNPPPETFPASATQRVASMSSTHDMLEAVAPLFVEPRGTAILSVSWLEEVLAGNADRGTLALATAWHLDAEDGSDRQRWLAPRDRILGTADTEEARWERLVHAVLERWDFAQMEGWRAALATIWAAHPMEGDKQSLMDELASWLHRFAASALRAELAQATTCQRYVEYVIDGAALGEDNIEWPLVSGIMDCLWQDTAGHWHVLLFDARRHSPNSRKDRWHGRQAGLVLAAQAVQRQLGTLPHTVALHRFAEDELTRSPATRLCSRRTLTRIGTVLRRLSRRETWR
ncbi:MAG: UvrD-helicase domain-containing protein [Gemmataceae bacterium]